MTKMWQWPCAGLMAFLFLGFAPTAWLTVVKGAKPSPPQAPVFTITLLQGGPAGDCYAPDMNNYGDVIGSGYLWVNNPTSPWLPNNTGNPIDLTTRILNDPAIWIWSDGVGEVITSGGHIELLFGSARINDNGLIVGSFLVWNADGTGPACGGYHAFRYNPAGNGGIAEFIDLGLGEPAAINNIGIVAGAVGTAAVIWPVLSGDEQRVEYPVGQSYAQSYAFDINNSCEVTGTFYNTLGQPRAYRAVSDGQNYWIYQDLGTLYSRGTPASMGWGINSLGHVAGDSIANAKGERHAFLYTDHMVDLGALRSYPHTRALRVNTNDWVVGWASTWVGGGAYKRAILHTGTAMYDLWSLIINPPSGSVATDIYASELDINDSYQICGSIKVLGDNGQYRQTPFILTKQTP